MPYIKSQKDELYTADELFSIKTALCETCGKEENLIEKITKMQNSIRDRNRQVIFFMPEKRTICFRFFKDKTLSATSAKMI